MTADDKLLNIGEVAVRLGISPEGVRRRISSGELKAVQLGPKGSGLRVAESDLTAYLLTHVVTR